MIVHALAGLLILSGSAVAAPVEDVPKLTRNALYAKGRLAKRTCTAKKGLTAASTEKYIKDVVACLDKVWGTKKTPVDIDHTPGDDRGKTFAGVALGGIMVFLQQDWIDAEPEYEYVIFNVLARTHGEVIMVRAGIQKTFFDMDHRADQKELDRRYSLQTVCLGGASNKALGRPLKTSLKGNERRWFTRGYKAGGPGACNTWTVPSSRVS
ncbi:hypothetical protein ACIBIZ_12150 [Nonomuraea spiralis]|uniref:hypothetical protein n=1 Tax=Nonomuraea spiralis TaxID=46182 RepID=UPI0037886B7D